MKKAKPSILVPYLLYMLIMGISMFAAYHQFGGAYGSLRMIQVLAIPELLLVVLCLVVISMKFNWRVHIFLDLNLKGLVWMLPVVLVLLYNGVVLIQQAGPELHQHSSQLLLVGFVTLLVGISEELMFRGIILRGLMGNTSPRWAVLISALAFSSLHAVNIFAGLTVTATISQLAMTFVFGLYAATVSLKIRNLWPLIIFHWLWDFMTFSYPLLSQSVELWTLLYVPAELLIGLILLWQLKTAPPATDKQ
ncbi:MAG: type II CAAX endopeptidase family protein [Cyclobacteriaceae bacterium]